MLFMLRTALLAPLAVAALLLGGCETMEGYPTDPAPSNELETLRSVYFPSAQACPDKTTATDSLECQYYDKDKSAAERQALRDKIVYGRMHVYDVEFSLFVRAVSANNNYLSVGSDLTALAFGGLAATTGDAATKSALAAVSSGVLAANGAVNKDLFYQKTIPAMVAQMEADRTKAEAGILQGLGRTDAEYPLARAQLDLDALNDAGSLNAAVVTITHDAGNAKAVAQSLIDLNRKTPYTESTEGNRIAVWLHPTATQTAADGTLEDSTGKRAPLDTGNRDKLVKWLNDNSLDGLPWEKLIDSPYLDVLRKNVVADLKIPEQTILK